MLRKALQTLVLVWKLILSCASQRAKDYSLQEKPDSQGFPGRVMNLFVAISLFLDQNSQDKISHFFGEWTHIPLKLCERFLVQIIHFRTREHR